jgi:hypothetical protein
MKRIFVPLIALAASATLARPDDPTYAEHIAKWRKEREEKLRADNGWLTLAGRFILKDGQNTFGTGKDNDVVFPPELKGTGPERLGTLVVDTKGKTVTLKPAAGVTMVSGDKEFTGDRVFDTTKRDWVGLGRFRMHVIARDGKYILRLADNQSELRKNFPGCVWYAPDERYRVEAKYMEYLEEKELTIVNVIGEKSKQPNPGYAEFTLNREPHTLDAIREGDGLFFVFRDATAGDTTYVQARFIDVEKRPKDRETFTLDFNTAYNPPCAFSEFTTCPTPPAQNVLKVRIEAGEKFSRKK